MSSDPGDDFPEEFKRAMLRHQRWVRVKRVTDSIGLVMLVALYKTIDFAIVCLIVYGAYKVLIWIKCLP